MHMYMYMYAQILIMRKSSEIRCKSDANHIFSGGGPPYTVRAGRKKEKSRKVDQNKRKTKETQGKHKGPVTLPEIGVRTVGGDPLYEGPGD